jgi:hypothetical protein
MAPEEVAADEFEADAAPAAPEGTASTLTSGLVFMTTVMLLASIVVIMFAMSKHFERGTTRGFPGLFRLGGRAPIGVL